ncbi:MAG: alpha/beta hydrolase [Stenotrophomonas sp.]
MPRITRILIGLAALLMVGVTGSLLIGQALITPVPRTIGPPPASLGARPVRIDSAAGPVSGWFVPGQADKGSVLLLHGVRSDRRQMLPRAQWLKQLGYSVLLIDLPAHGQSPAAHITFGANESKAVDAAVTFLGQQAPGRAVAVIGVSLGAASTVLSASTRQLAAVVLESMYPSLDQAVADRLAIRLGAPGRPLAPLLLWQLPLRLQLSADDLRPIDHLAAIGAPVLIASGSRDRHTPIDEARALYRAAAAPKQFWEVPGAAHVDLYAHDPAAYQRVVGAFLQSRLQQ